jgi:hypothetical protein
MQLSIPQLFSRFSVFPPRALSLIGRSTVDVKQWQRATHHRPRWIRTGQRYHSRIRPICTGLISLALIPYMPHFQSETQREKVADHHYLHDWTPKAHPFWKDWRDAQGRGDGDIKAAATTPRSGWNPSGQFCSGLLHIDTRFNPRYSCRLSAYLYLQHDCQNRT